MDDINLLLWSFLVILAPALVEIVIVEIWLYRHPPFGRR